MDRAWAWRLVTVSVRWKPWDAGDYTVAGLRRRAKEALEAWRRVWSGGLRCGGLASAAHNVELAPDGLVHVHALVWSPWVSKAWLSRLAGCFVDVRRVAPSGNRIDRVGYEEALRGAIKEAAKYTVKVHSPLDAAFVAGESRARMVHPELAARWAIATHRAQLRGIMGPLRDALAAHQAAKPEGAASRPRSCACCGQALTSRPREVPVREIAREVKRRGLVWRELLEIERPPPQARAR